eukprot:comp21900_c1_seq1/m.49713 comp21900_c1_seq1/g.49713  ORF comp21900_c1_seq1/g.49713 comp21900_c1_seq1/m.49713 type:complete len:371 (+) comp21900_c1_seq1:259-1371(+)
MEHDVVLGGLELLELEHPAKHVEARRRNVVVEMSRDDVLNDGRVAARSAAQGMVHVDACIEISIFARIEERAQILKDLEREIAAFYSFVGDTHALDNHQGLCDHGLLDCLVERRRQIDHGAIGHVLFKIGAQRRIAVHFEEPGHVFAVEHHIEPEDLEAARDGLGAVLAAKDIAVRLDQRNAHRMQCVCHKLRDAGPDGRRERWSICSCACGDLCKHRGQHALRCVVLVGVFGMHKVLAVLVHGIVGEMHERLAQILERKFVGLCAKSPQAFGAQIGAERIHAHQQHIEPQIKLESAEQQWMRNVFLDHRELLDADHDLVEVACEKNAVTMRSLAGLDDENLALGTGALCKCTECLFFAGNHKCLRDKRL